MNAMDLAYRRTAATGASGLTLLIALYDTIAGDLRRAAAAQRAGDLEKRSREVKHALAVLAVLENWIDSESGELARKLLRFYARLRKTMIDAQAKQSAEMLERMMADVLGIRELWQQMEAEGEGTSAPQYLPPVARQRQSASFSVEPEKTRMNWSA